MTEQRSDERVTRSMLRADARSPAVWPASVVVGACALIVYGWQAGAPSPWRDEAVTMGISRRTAAQILALTQHIDVVHLLYYLLAHMMVRLDDSLTAVRWISVVAMAGAAVVLVDVGRRLGGRSVGLVAGVLLVVSPLASRYAQEARPFALVVLVAVVATDLMILAAEPSARPSRWVWYSGSLVLLCVLNVLALLLLSAHAAWILLTGSPQLRRRWLVAAAGGTVAALPMLIFAFAQRAQVSWITAPHLYDLNAVYIHAYGSKLVPVAVVLLCAGLLLLTAVRRFPERWRPSEGVHRTAKLGVCWAVVPPVLLFVLSQRSSFWDLHYLLYSLPGFALLIAALVQALADLAGPALARTGVAVIAVIAVGVAGLPDQIAYRDPAVGHQEDLRGVAAYLDAQARPGDAILYAPFKLRAISSSFLGTARQLRDPALAVEPVPSETINGVEVAPEALPARLTGVTRAWLIHSDAIGPSTITATDHAKFGLPRLGFILAGHQQISSITVDLFVRSAAART